jgi:hypothetical protein
MCTCIYMYLLTVDFFFKSFILNDLNYLFFERLLLKHYSPHHSTNLRIRQIGSHLQFLKIWARTVFIFPVNGQPSAFCWAFSALFSQTAHIEK